MATRRRTTARRTTRRSSTARTRTRRSTGYATRVRRAKPRVQRGSRRAPQTIKLVIETAQSSPVNPITAPLQAAKAPEEPRKAKF